VEILSFGSLMKRKIPLSFPSLYESVTLNHEGQKFI
jgi:hypothetical protein